jgi:hypothetical protein
MGWFNIKAMTTNYAYLFDDNSSAAVGIHTIQVRFNSGYNYLQLSCKGSGLATERYLNIELIKTITLLLPQ